MIEINGQKVAVPEVRAILIMAIIELSSDELEQWIKEDAELGQLIENNYIN